VTPISRKAAITAHPDKGGSEAKMARVNEAYGLLTNPGKQLFTVNITELRRRFDNGDDPNDPGSQGGAPFTGYGSPLVVAEIIRLHSFSVLVW
jgi:DnaJ family protein C protein 3